MAETQQGGELTGAEAQKTTAGDRTNERAPGVAVVGRSRSDHVGGHRDEEGVVHPRG